jgi:hypothetical protein
MQWNVVYWIWPVKSDKGNRFERVVLLMPGKASVRTMPGGGPEPRTDPVSSLGQQSYAVSAAARASSVTSLDAGRRFLVDFARDLVRVRPGATATKTSVSAARG